MNAQIIGKDQSIGDWDKPEIAIFWVSGCWETWSRGIRAFAT